jgi:hypothetical protein
MTYLGYLRINNTILSQGLYGFTLIVPPKREQYTELYTRSNKMELQKIEQEKPVLEYLTTEAPRRYGSGAQYMNTSDDPSPGQGWGTIIPDGKGGFTYITPNMPTPEMPDTTGKGYAPLDHGYRQDRGQERVPLHQRIEDSRWITPPQEQPERTPSERGVQIINPGYIFGGSLQGTAEYRMKIDAHRERVERERFRDWVHSPGTSQYSN